MFIKLSLKRFVHDLISAIVEPLHGATFADMQHDHSLAAKGGGCIMTGRVQILRLS
jgi:hypothetical protein